MTFETTLRSRFIRSSEFSVPDPLKSLFPFNGLFTDGSGVKFYTNIVRTDFVVSE